MESLRLNEKLLRIVGRSVAEMGAGELQKLDIKIDERGIYKYDEGGHICRVTDHYASDGELGWSVKLEDYYVVDWKGELSLNTIEQVGNSRGKNPSDKSKKGRSGGRSGRGRGGFEWGKDQRYVCGVWMRAECEHCGYKYWVRVPCSREWCPECGKPGSLYHRRLYFQVLHYALQMWAMRGAVGYLVITCTEELRERWKDPEELRKFQEYIRRMLKREGLWPALYRWHFAGDKGRRWYPHLNLLFPLGYIEKEKLERIRRLIERRTGIKMIKYGYTRSVSKIRHLARYVSRPTWNLQDEVEPAKFKYFRKWGVWGKDKMAPAREFMNRRESEEFWAGLSLYLALMLEGYSDIEGAREAGDNVDELIKRFLKKVEEASGVRVEGLENVALEDGESGLKELAKVLWRKLAEVKGYPFLEELAGFVVLHGRCIGCFKKLRWKWKKSPFIALGQRVYKVGWGIWVVVDKEGEDEEFPF
jgi:hypothetical protein